MTLKRKQCGKQTKENSKKRCLVVLEDDLKKTSNWKYITKDKKELIFFKVKK